MIDTCGMLNSNDTIMFGIDDLNGREVGEVSR